MKYDIITITPEPQKPDISIRLTWQEAINLRFDIAKVAHPTANTVEIYNKLDHIVGTR